MTVNLFKNSRGIRIERELLHGILMFCMPACEMFLSLFVQRQKQLVHPHNFVWNCTFSPAKNTAQIICHVARALLRYFVEFLRSIRVQNKWSSMIKKKSLTTAAKESFHHFKQSKSSLIQIIGICI